jgi:hypothetical protein
VYDRAIGKAELHGGDAGWDQVWEVVDGRVPGLILAPEEIQWLQACWRACMG